MEHLRLIIWKEAGCIGQTLDRRWTLLDVEEDQIAWKLRGETILNWGCVILLMNVREITVAAPNG